MPRKATIGHKGYRGVGGDPDRRNVRPDTGARKSAKKVRDLEAVAKQFAPLVLRRWRPGTDPFRILQGWAERLGTDPGTVLRAFSERPGTDTATVLRDLAERLGKDPATVLQDMEGFESASE